MLRKLKALLAKVALRGITSKEDQALQAKLEKELGLEPGSLFEPQLRRLPPPPDKHHRPPVLSFDQAINLAGEQDAREYLTRKEFRKYQQLLRKRGQLDADEFLHRCCQMTAVETEPKGITHARRHLSGAELEAYTVFSAKGIPEAGAFLQRCLDRRTAQ